MSFNDNNNNYNFILDTDSYKVGHPSMYGRKKFKDGRMMKLVRMYDYLGPRLGGEFPEIVTAGTQHVAKILAHARITKEHVDEAETFYEAHLGPGVFDRTPWDVVVNKYGGCLPLKFSALPEGTIVPLGTPMVTVESTSEEFPTIVSHFEALVQKYVWYMSTVATKSLEFSKTIYSFWKDCVNPDVTANIFGFIHHDFGHRATTSTVASQLGGAAHLYISRGTDTVPGVKYIMDNMGEPDGNGGIKMPGFSVRATEHSVMTSRGREGEMEVFDDILDSTPPNVILSCVADSYDLMNFVNNVTTGERKDRIMARTGKVVIRPDSNLIKNGKKLSSAETVLECLNLMETNLQDVMTRNEKGFKVLPKQYGTIIGDGLNIKKVHDILHLMTTNMWSPENMVFGTGGNLLQVDITRETGNFAMKASQLEFHIDKEDGSSHREIHDIAKETPGKESIKGRVQVSLVDGKIVTVPEGTIPQVNLLRVLSMNGNMCIPVDHIGTIRQRIQNHRATMNY
jgi:nicotinamide phosphoribosyltransferase